MYIYQEYVLLYQNQVKDVRYKVSKMTIVLKLISKQTNS